MFHYGENETASGASIKVVGVGGAGCHAINRMIEEGVRGVEFIAMNTDMKSLGTCKADRQVQMGEALTRGLGAGSDPDIGLKAAQEAKEQIGDVLSGADMVFVTAGMGGGTGTGAAPLVSQMAMDTSALTVAVVTMPFHFEGRRKRRLAEDGIKKLADAVDTLIVIPNDRLLEVIESKVSLIDAFHFADDVLRQGVQSISDLINVPGLINLDLNDLRTVMCRSGSALIGIGRSRDQETHPREERSLAAAKAAISSPFLEASIAGARGVLLNITGSSSLSIMEVNEAANLITQAADEEADIIFGAAIDEDLGEEVEITVIATGFPLAEDASSRKAVSAAERDDVDVPPFLRSR